MPGSMLLKKLVTKKQGIYSLLPWLPAGVFFVAFLPFRQDAQHGILTVHVQMGSVIEG
jgi:hypothetical protein